jgi:hypothetical protein
MAENDLMIRQPEESVWKRLTRLFRSGPVIRHKIASAEPDRQPRGTAAAFKKEISSLYVHSLASYGQYERLSRYADYSEMEFTPEIASALDIYADEVTAKNEHDEVLQIICKDDEIKQILETLFYDILNIEFNVWSWTRNLVKYGDFILFVDASEENGILNMLPIPINEIEREEGYDKKDPFAVRFRWLTQGNMILENWQIVHIRLLGNDNFLPYGSSIIEPARRIWRQLILIEDAMLVYRIVRSPERRVFKIDVGNIAPDAVPQYIEQVKTAMKRQQITDPTSGRVDLRYNPLSVDEDYFIPVRGDRSSDISTLAGGQFTGDIDDVQYIQNKLFAALKIPKAYLAYVDGDGSKSSLAQLDIRFARTIDRVQKILVAELNKVAIIHLFLLGYKGEQLVDFELKLANSSIIAQQQFLELWRTKLEIAASAQEGVFDREFIWKQIFKLSDEDIDRIREGKKFDKIEDLYLEQVQLPGAGAAPGGEEGTDELPATLGGAGGAPPPGPEGEPPPGGEEGPPPGAGGPGPETAGVTRVGDLVEQADTCAHCGGGIPNDNCEHACWVRWTNGGKVNEVPNKGSTDPLGTKQAPFRTLSSPLKIASMTPQFHNKNGHKPSARDPLQVFKRVARGHTSAEGRKRKGVMTESWEDKVRKKFHLVEDVRTIDEQDIQIAEEVEGYVKDVFADLNEIKKKT